MKTIHCKCDICGYEESVPFIDGEAPKIPLFEIPTYLRFFGQHESLPAFGREFSRKQFCTLCADKFDACLKQNMQEAVNKAVAAVLSPVNFDKELEELLK